MKRFALATLMGAILLVGAVGAAMASTYQLNFDSLQFDVMANVDVDGLNNVTGISGSVAGVNGGTITGLSPGDPNWITDNQFFPNNDPVVTNAGILFAANSWLYNLYSVGPGAYLLSTFNPNGEFYNPGIIGTLSVSAVPLPDTVWLFGGGLAGLGILAYMRKRREKRAVGFIPAPSFA